MPEEMTDAEILAAAEAEELEAVEVTEAQEITAAEEEATKVDEDEAARLAAGGEPKPKGNSFQDRINEMSWKQHNAEREKEYWKNLAQGKAGKGENQIDTPVKAAEISGTSRPKPDSFETVEAYEDALFGWYDEKKSAKTAAKNQETEFKDLLSTFNKSAAPVRIEHPDFDEITARPVFTKVMQRAVLNLKDGALVAYEIGRNPELAEKFKVLTPEKVMYEMTKLEHRLTLVQKTKKKSVTPNPIKPLGGLTKIEKDPDKMDIKEWMVWDKKRTMAKIRKGLGYKEE